MRSAFISAATVGLLALQANTWSCIGKDCSQSQQNGQIVFSSSIHLKESVEQLVLTTKSSGLIPPGAGWTWARCGAGDEIVSVESIDVSPDPPKPGQNLTVRAKGTISDQVSDGTFADVVVRLGLIKLLTRRFDVCEEARANNAELQCPLDPGEYELTHTVALPREIPPAKFNVHIIGENQDGEPLLCLDLSINFMNR